ncbi:MAG: hypothetical protein F6J93_27710 [Oscillatoria sp. SIO1A7]|nr:hypothetical protein [Oscillatoria sp. SIO1A7]
MTNIQVKNVSELGSFPFKDNWLLERNGKLMAYIGQGCKSSVLENPYCLSGYNRESINLYQRLLYREFRHYLATKKKSKAIASIIQLACSHKNIDLYCDREPLDSHGSYIARIIDLFQVEWVMLCGSRSCQSLPKKAIACLHQEIEQESFFLVGDAPGADRLWQEEIVKADYRRAIVFAPNGLVVRNNLLGRKAILVPNGGYQKRDEIMRRHSQSALAVWDGKSAGTKRTIELMNQCEVFRF